MVYVRPFLCLSLAASLAACSSSPVDLTPRAVASATPVAVTATATPASTSPTATPTSAPATTAPTSTPATTAPTATPTAAPTATAAPTSTSSASPIVSNNDPLAFIDNPNQSGCSSHLTQGFGVSEAGYSGSFTAVSSNTAIITVVQNDGQDFTATEESTTAVAQGTPVNVTVSDTNGNKLVIPATFTLTCVP